MAADEFAEVRVGEEGRLVVSGPVTIENVVAVMEQGTALFDRQDFTVDLGGITDVDSSAASLLLHWEREALDRNQRLVFVNIPQKLQTLLRLYGISGLINGNASRPDPAAFAETASSQRGG
ncbi:MAG TPA: STAS domain-containing protein [Nitrosospira sp.]|nr:STAS domain-containing protein [Nitrosospira sp.]